MKFKKILMSICLFVINSIHILAGSPNNALVSRLYGNYYSPAIPSQIQGISGTLDITFAQNGYENLSSQMSNGNAVIMQTLADGNFLVVLQATGVNSVLAKYSAQGVLEPSYEVVDLGSLAILPRAAMIDPQNRMIVGGGAALGSSGWISRINQLGDEIIPFQVGSSWQYINCLGQQTTGKIVAAGLNQTNAQLARFNLDGTLDRTFGASGFIYFNSNSGLPVVTSDVNFIIDGQNNIYVTFVDGSFNVFVAKFLSTGVLDTSWASTGIQQISYLSPADQGWKSALDMHGNLVITGASNGVIKVTAIATSTGGTPSPAFTNTIIESQDEILTIGGIITTQDQINQDVSSIIIIGTNATINQQRITKLYGSGGLDISFNNGLGYLQFQAFSGGTNSSLNSISLAPTGEIYSCGQEADGAGAISPFVYKVYNNYATENSLYPISVIEQGVIDTTFGLQSGSSDQKQIYPGIVMPYVGSYKGTLQQHASSIVQVSNDYLGSLPTQGDFIVGMYGSIDNSQSDYPVNMMLNFLTQDGQLDTNVGSNESGQLILNNLTSSNEFLYAVAQDESGAVYVAGSAQNHGPTLRKYSQTSTTEWTEGVSDWASIDTTLATSQGIGVAVQGQNLVVLCENLNSVQGRLAAYDLQTGHLANGLDDAPTFGYQGSGYIDTLSYAGLSMGPVYGCVINAHGSIFVAYKSVATRYIDVAGINPTGSGLLTDFGTGGVIFNLFASVSDDSINSSNVRIAFDNAGNLLVAAVVNDRIVVSKINQVTGSIDQSFGTNGIAIVTVSSPSINCLQGLSDGSILISGSLNDSLMYLMKLTPQGVLDGSFNGQGSLPGVAYINQESNSIQAQATSFAVDQSTGNIVVAGFQDMYYTDASPIVSRIFGKAGTIAVKNFPNYIDYLGNRDVSFNNSGAFNLSDLVADGTAQVLYVYPFGSNYQGLMLIGMSDDNYSYVARFNPINLTLDSTFNADQTPGYYQTALGQVGISCLMVDAQDRIVFAGYDDVNSWAQRLTIDGSFDVAFDLSQVKEINAIAQQKSGRYICCGDIIGFSPGIFAFQDALTNNKTKLALDTTFNPLHDIPGTFPVTQDQIYSLVINNDDTILVGWASYFYNEHLYIYKIMANGSDYIRSFGDRGALDTGIIIYNDPKTALIACDTQGNILAAGSTSADDIQIGRFLGSTGQIDSSWNSGQIATYNGFGHSVKLTDIITSQTGQTVFIGYNVIRRVNGINGPLFAVSLDENGGLDPNWNPYPSGQDVPGILTYHVIDSTIMGQGGFAPNGNLFVVGGTGAEPLVMEIVAAGLPVEQAPLAIDAGIIDTTINTQGTEYPSLNIDDLLSVFLGTPSQLHIINGGNGQMFMASQLNSSSYVTKFDAALQLDTNFNSIVVGASMPGIVSIDRTSSVHSLFVDDAQGDLGFVYLTGDTSDAGMWAAMISPDGYYTINLTVSNNLTTGRAICKGKNNILIAGQSSDNGTPGVIFASTSDMSGIDSSFGNGTPGYFSTGINSTISAMALDNQYRIYIAYENMGRNRLVVQRISADGSAVDFTAEHSPNSSNPQQIKMVLDQQHDQFVVANYYDSSIAVSRYSMINGSLQGNERIYINSQSLELADLFIDTDRNIYIVGDNNTDPYQTIIARIKSIDDETIELDPTYAADGPTPGIANLVVTPMNTSGSLIKAGILHPDRRVYIVGTTSENVAYMARFFGDSYAQEVCQAVRLATAGDFDPYYGNSLGYVTTYAGSTPYNPIADQQVKGIVHLPGTKLMTVVDDGVNSWTIKVLQDGTNDPAYGNPLGQGALIEKLSGNENVSSMILSGVEEYFVIGQNSIYGGYLKKIGANGTMSQTFGGYTGAAASTSYPVGTVYGLMSNPSALVELSDGSIVIAGNNAGVGSLQKIGSTGLINQTFTDLSLAMSGVNIASIVADASNNLYVAICFAFDEGYAVRIAQLTQNGQLVWQNDTALYGANDPYTIQLALDELGNILVAATSGQQNGNLHVTRLLSTGAVDSNFNNGTPLNIQVSDSSQFALANIADVICLQDGRTLIAGYYQDLLMAENNAQFVLAVNRYGNLDTTFNYYQNQGSIQGIALFQTDSTPQQSRTVFAMDVQSNGNIMLASSQSPTVDEQTPVTIRLIGYMDDQAVAKYPGQTINLPSVLDTSFANTGVATTAFLIENLLIAGGAVVIDSMGRSIIAGLTESGVFILARFLVDGVLDTTFGTDGIAMSGEVSNMTANCSLAIDPFNNFYVCGVSLPTNQQGQFIVVKFDDNGSVDTSFGNDGTLIASPENNLVSGGYITYDAGKDYILFSGYSSDGTFILYCYSSDGQTLLYGIIPTSIPVLIDGGYIAVDRNHGIYVAGRTATSLVVIKFIQTDEDIIRVATDYGISGIVTIDIPSLQDGGTIALDFYDNIVIGCYNSDLQCAVIRLTTTGDLDTSFNETGIAYTVPVTNLEEIGSIGIGSLNDVILGGRARGYNGIGNFVVANFTTDGNPNLQFYPDGTAVINIADAIRTISNAGLTGGFIATNLQGQIFVAGVDNPTIATPGGSKLVVAKCYSGYETFITDPRTLSPESLKNYFYGNETGYVNRAISLEILAKVIPDATVRQLVIDEIQAIFDTYYLRYTGVAGFNLVGHVYLVELELQALQNILMNDYPAWSDQITTCFNSLIERIINLKLSNS